MNNNNSNNAGLLLVVLLIGAVAFVGFNSNISFKGVLKQGIQQQQKDDYQSPFGPRPSKVFESQWEAERAR